MKTYIKPYSIIYNIVIANVMTGSYESTDTDIDEMPWGESSGYRTNIWNINGIWED